ncbi:MAG: TolC family protein [Vicinamibacterales bacterium]
MRTTRGPLARALPCVAAGVLLLGPAAWPAAAQQAPPPALTLEQVLDMAEAGSESIAVAQAGVRRAEGADVISRSGLFPQLNLSGGYDRALATEFQGLFGGTGGGAPACDPFAIDPTASLDARVTEIERAIDCGAVGGDPFGGGQGGTNANALPFGRANTWRVTLALSQTLYSGGRLEAQQALARAGGDAAALALTGARAQLLFDVTQAYYDAVLSNRLVAIAEATLEQAEATLLRTQAGFRAGTQPEFELLRARVNRDNQRPALIRQRVNRDLAMLRLKQRLELPAAADLRLADDLSGDDLPPAPVFAERVTSVEAMLMAAADPIQPVVQAGPQLLPERAAVLEAGVAVRSSEAALDAALAERKPSVTLTSTYGRVSYPTGFLWGFSSLRTNWTVGANVQLPLLTGGRLRGTALVARAELEQSQARLRQVEELAELDSRSALAELIAARAAWESTAGTIEQASRAYGIAEVRFQAGLSTQLELSDSRLLLQQAEANRAQAARDLQVARARLALLPGLPLGTGGGAAPAAPAGPAQQPANQNQNAQFASATTQPGAQQTGGRQ